ncbi:helix-turn-helix domain-containing protein [Streptomyces sp. NPDC006339]|uniref:AraC-like ligand-binding domain-containing protein n=1 Tax=Streptomyces sp. NPDC006339 TaxID=3156755 RepID=UPI0033B223C5
MLTTVLDTSSLPRPERTEAWAAATARALLTTRLRFPDPERFDASMRATALGQARLSVLTYQPLTCHRSAAHIRRSDPELYQLALITSGRHTVEQAGRRAVCGPGDLVLYDSSRPVDVVAGPDGHPGGHAGGCVLLQFPRSQMRLPEKPVAAACATSLKASRGLRRVLRETLGTLGRAPDDFDDNDRVRMASTLVQLAASVVAGHVERAGELPAPSRAAALYHETREFIAAHLHDPDLDPAAVAAAHHVSLRTLHRAYASFESTVSDTIRRERIGHCRRDLENPLLDASPVSAIGARWGYPRASDFTRAFKAAVGMPPAAYRAAVRRGPRA